MNIDLNLFSISGLLIGISSLFFGFFILNKGSKNKANRLWAIFCFFVAVWGFGGYKIGAVPFGEEDAARLWWRLTHMGIIFIPVLFLHFIYVWLNIKEKLIIYFGYLQGFFFLAINLYDLSMRSATGLFIHKMEWVFDSFYWDTHLTLDFYWAYVFLWVFLVLYAHYKLIKSYKNSSGVKKTQIKYFLFGFVVSYSGGSVCYLPCFGINIYPFFNLMTPFYPILLTYAIIKYRFMDVYWILGRVSIYVLSFLTIFLYSISVFFLNQKFNIAPPLVFIILIISTIIPFFLYCFRFYEKIAGKYFYYTYYSLKQTLQQVGNKLNQTVELKKLTNLINTSLKNSLELKRVGVVLKDPKKGKFNIQDVINFTAEDILSLFAAEDSFLVQYLAEIKKPIVVEEIPYIIAKTEEINARAPIGAKQPIQQRAAELGLLEKDMRRMGAEILLPLLIEQELIGVIIIGGKQPRQAYTVQDMVLLSSFASQASTAFNSALSNKEIYERKEELEKFYKLTVGRELKMAELKKKIKDMEDRTTDI